MAEKPAGVFGGQGADSGEQVSQGAGRFVAYGIFWESRDVHVVFIGNGVEEIVELPLNLTEQKEFAKSVDSVNKLLDILKK